MQDFYLVVTFDYETRSELDVTKVGAPKYARHWSTEIVCASWAVDDGPVQTWKPLEGEPIPPELLRLMRNKRALFEAHNAMFEQCITEFVLRRDYPEVPHMPPERWDDSAARAGACAMPRSLEGLCKALNTKVQKDMTGHRIMKKLMKPRPAWKKTRQGSKYPDKQSDYEATYSYNADDILAERGASHRLPPLIPQEREIWLANQKMNLQGVCIDLPVVKRVIKMIAEEFIDINKRCKALTNGTINSPTERDRVLKWVRARGYKIPNLQSATVEEWLKKTKGPARELLEMRQAVGLASIKKYHAMRTRADDDGRVRDLTLYHGASTGRESGRGLQVQNLVKAPSGFDQDLAIKIISTEDREFIKLIYGDLFKVFAACLRGMITASPGYELWSADYNAIEARILHWICDFQPGLKAWTSGADQYKKMAKVIYIVNEEDVTDDQRFVGKQAVLGCGFGMGWKKFMLQCQKFGREVPASTCKTAVEKYRQTHKPIVDSWKNTERAAIQAVLNPGKRYTANKATWFVEGEFLWAELPSTRRLAYYKPTIRNEAAPWGDLIPKLYHWQSHPKNPKLWVNGATWGGKLVENLVQAIARDLMFAAVVRARKAGYQYLFSVHDEGNFENRIGKGKQEEFYKLLTDLPDWAKGLPVKVSGWHGHRYRKS